MLISKQDKQYLFDSVTALRDDAELNRQSLVSLCDVSDMLLALIAANPLPAKKSISRQQMDLDVVSPPPKKAKKRAKKEKK